MANASFAAAVAAGGLFTLFAAPASAQQLVYTPINPAFGGNPLNSSQLEADANSQNQYRPQTNANLTQAQLFQQELQSELLADLANQVSQAIFGPNAQASGTFAFGGETVTFARALGEITVTITSPSGAETTIELPEPASGATAPTTNPTGAPGN